MSKMITLSGRLKNALTTELEALEQMSKTVELTELGKNRLEKLRKKKKVVDKSEKV